MASGSTYYAVLYYHFGEELSGLALSKYFCRTSKTLKIQIYQNSFNLLI